MNEAKKQDMEVLKRVLKLFKPYKKNIIVIFVLIFLSSGIQVLNPLISKKVMDDGLLARNFTLVVQFALISFFLVLIRQGLELIETKYRSYLSAMMPYSLLKTTLKHLMKIRIQFFNNTNASEIMSNMGMDIGNISRVSDRSTFFIVTQAFRIVGGIVGLLIIDWKMTFIVIFLVPIRYFIVKYLAKLRRKCFEEFMQYNREYSMWFGDIIGGIKEVRLWGIDNIITGQFVKKQRKMIKANIKMSFMDKVNEMSENIIFEIITNALYILGAYMIFNSTLTVGGLFAFISYSAYVTGPISAILNIGYSFSNVVPSAKRLFALLDTETEEEHTSESLIRLEDKEIKGNIRFENVAFSYNDNDPVLKNISFEIKPGEKIAIIGTNGSGKTTLVNLLLRLYKPESGKIYLDGMDVSRIKLRDYRGLISFVNQDLYLFSTTIKNNIALFTPKDELNIHRAAKESRAYEFIEQMPDKYDSEIGRNGAKLSGGERQKVAMARAFLRESKILIFDEATSNYDMMSEIEVNKLIESGFPESTVIVITHRPDMLRRVDRILFVENGTIADIGTHDELVERNAVYRYIINESLEKAEKNIG